MKCLIGFLFHTALFRRSFVSSPGEFLPWACIPRSLKTTLHSN